MINNDVCQEKLSNRRYPTDTYYAQTDSGIRSLFWSTLAHNIKHCYRYPYYFFFSYDGLCEFHSLYRPR